MESTGLVPGVFETAGAEAYAVKVPVFEGPLDLLLHLIRLNEVDVTDIPIAAIARQYTEYLGLMHELNLDVAGEYLLMAATLAWIKSRMLLPPPETEDGEEGLDPRAELVARLLEYQRFKEVAGELGERQLLGRDVYSAQGSEAEGTPEAEREIEVGLLALIEAFRRVVLRAQAASATHEVETEQITVRDCMLTVMSKLEHVETLEFERVFDNEAGTPPSRAALVTTFLAILELARLAALRLFQSLGDDGAPQGPIRLRRLLDASTDWNERIAEIM